MKRKKRHKKILLSLTEGIDNELERLAEQTGRSKTDLIREAIFLLIQAYAAQTYDAERESRDDI